VSFSTATPDYDSYHDEGSIRHLNAFNLRHCGAHSMVFLLMFLLGCVDGLRSLTPPALVCWAAHLGWLHFEGTKLAFIDHWATLTIFTLLAVVELVADKLPNTPARTAPLGLAARISLGGACGLAVATSEGISLSFSVLLAAIGGFVAAFVGYHSRRLMVSKAHVSDLAVAVAEDLIAIAGALLILYQVGQ
jgi:uncharacterized membrane protein